MKMSPLLALLICLVLSTPSTLSSLVFLGPSQYLLSLPSFYPSTCVLPPHPVGRGLNGAVAGINGKYQGHEEQLVVCGGYNGQWSNLASCHALVQGQWIEMEPLTTERAHASASVDAVGRLLITGGKDASSNILHSTEVLLLNGFWSSGPDLLWGARMQHCQLTTRIGILVIGGFNYEDGSLASVINLAPHTSSWVPLSSMMSPREAFACTVKDDDVWVIGGFLDDSTRTGGGFLATTEVFSLSTLTWRQGPELPYAVNWGQAVQYEGDLYHVGGIKSKGKVLKLVEDVWEVVANTGYDDVRDISQASVIVEDGCHLFFGCSC